MTKLNLTLGIILSLGSVGCAGLSGQASGGLTAIPESPRGIDTLWVAPATESRSGVAGTLRRTDAQASRADLWNPAPAGSGRDARTERGPRGGLYVSDASSGIAF